MNLDILKKRADLFRLTRDFFSGRGYLEVDTPILSPALIPETSIEIFRTSLLSPYRKPQDLYLIPSPEVWMKRLLAQGSGNIYQITKCFRNWEQQGPWHENEFTMLEWYTLEADYMDSMEITEAFLSSVSGRARSKDYFTPPFIKMSMEEAFKEYAEIDLLLCQDRETLFAEAEKLACFPAADDSWEVLFNRIFLSRVEPALPKDKPVFLYDYPAAIPCLAKSKTGTPWAQRWEMYCGGIETANCFTEETDPETVKAFFLREGDIKKKAETPHPPDREFLKIFAEGYPPSSGVALGMDRLLMALTGESSVGGLIFFPLSDMLSP